MNYEPNVLQIKGAGSSSVVSIRRHWKRMKSGLTKIPHTTNSANRYRTSVWNPKATMGLYLYLMKGKEHVLSEVNLMMMCYNLRRLMNVTGHFGKVSLTHQIESYRIINIEYLSNKTESYRIIY